MCSLFLLLFFYSIRFFFIPITIFFVLHFLLSPQSFLFFLKALYLLTPFIFHFISSNFLFALISRFVVILTVIEIKLKVMFTTMFKFIVRFIEVVGRIVYSHNFKENMQIKNAMFNMEIIAHLDFLKQEKSP
jgi:hypothetical protein